MTGEGLGAGQLSELVDERRRPALKAPASATSIGRFGPAHTRPPKHPVSDWWDRAVDWAADLMISDRTPFTNPAAPHPPRGVAAAAPPVEPSVPPAGLREVGNPPSMMSRECWAGQHWKCVSGGCTCTCHGIAAHHQ